MWFDIKFDFYKIKRDDDDSIFVRNSSTFSPRAVLFGLKGSFGSSLVEPPNKELSAWDGSLQTIHQEDFYSATEVVMEPQWNKSIELSHRTKVELQEVKTGTDNFGSYDSGEQYANSRKIEFEEITDNIRYFVEQCDYLQGFHNFIDINSGFSGLSCEIINWIKDEYQNSKLITFAITNDSNQYIINNSNNNNNKDLLIYNINKSLNNLSELSNLYFPISFQSWNSNEKFPLMKTNNSDYYSNERDYCKIIGSIMDSCFIPMRSNELRFNLNTICNILNPVSKMNITAINTSYPLPVSSMSQSVPTNILTNILKSDYIQSITQKYDKTVTPISEISVLRGINRNKMSDVDYFTNMFHTGTNYKHSWRIDNKYIVPTTFPDIFVPQLNVDGTLNSLSNSIENNNSINNNNYNNNNDKIERSDRVENISVYATMQLSKGMYPYLKLVTDAFGNLNYHKLDSSVDGEHMKDVLDNLLSIKDQYK